MSEIVSVLNRNSVSVSERNMLEQATPHIITIRHDHGGGHRDQVLPPPPPPLLLPPPPPPPLESWAYLIVRRLAEPKNAALCDDETSELGNEF